MTSLRRVSPAEARRLVREPVDPPTLAEAARLVDEVRRGGEAALRRLAARLDGLAPDAELIAGRERLEEARAALAREDRELLERTAGRIAAFARAQLAALSPVAIPLPGGHAGHTIAPVERAGCYAPGGRHPLPSSVLMTAVTARVAGVQSVWVASPAAGGVMLAAAAVAGADAVLRAGGAHAVAALAFGAGPVPSCDVIVGPGNRWVTAAKQIVSGSRRIDFLAGPSELVVLADESADADLVAADLVAQAEHDPRAWPVLVATSEAFARAVEAALERAVAPLPTAAAARAALGRGLAVVAADLDEAIETCNVLAPEHLQVHVRDPRDVAARLRHYGALFLGTGAAEVLGDYGAGPNHVLPTGGTARSRGGLCVLDFLRVRTWMRIDDLRAASGLLEDAARLARLEGLEGHARAAERRRPQDGAGGTPRDPPDQ